MHNSQSIVFPLMVGIHDIAALLREQLLPVTPRPDSAIPHHNPDTALCYFVTPCFRKETAMSFDKTRLSDIVNNERQ